jgi:outer membrane protein assembly factor BamB
VNTTKFLPAILAAAAGLAFVATAGAADDNAKNWPQWRGPLATGVAPESNPPTTWSEKQNVKWKVKCVGGGSASPIVWGDKIFVLAAEPAGKPGAPKAGAEPKAAAAPKFGPGAKMGPGAKFGPGGGMPMATKPTSAWKFEVLCFDRGTGKLLWQKTAKETVPHEGHHQTDGGYACYSPVTDGKYVYADFGSRGLYCYDFDGNKKWERDLGKLSIVMQFGEGGSPALAGDTLFVCHDNEDESRLFAIDKKTGESLWERKRNEKTGWSTPLVVEYKGQTQIVISATNRIRAYDARNAGLIWECGGMTKNVIPTPVSGLGMVFAASGFRGNALLAIALGGTGDLTDSKSIKWSVDRATPYVPSPMLYGDKLYFLSNNNGILSCYQADTGTANFSQKRLEGISMIYASPVGAGDHVYFVGRNGRSTRRSTPHPRSRATRSSFAARNISIASRRTSASPILDQRVGESRRLCFSITQCRLKEEVMLMHNLYLLLEKIDGADHSDIRLCQGADSRVGIGEAKD